MQKQEPDRSSPTYFCCLLHYSIFFMLTGFPSNWFSLKVQSCPQPQPLQMLHGERTSPTAPLHPTLPSWAWLSSSAYCAAFPLLCHSLVCSGSSKVKSTETLISEALAHSALEIRILVHYTQLLAEQSSVTGKHNAGARGSDLEL